MNTDYSKLRILYVGDLTPGCTSRQRMQALLDLGCKVTPISWVDSSWSAKTPYLWFRIRYKVLGPKDTTGANPAILEAVKKDKYNLVWLDKVLTVRASTLQKLHILDPTVKVVGYSPDDMFAKHNQSPQFRKSCSLYDVFFTTKSYGIEELPLIGCSKVVFIGNAFDPHTHRQLPVSETDRVRLGCEVGFIGTYEKDRANAMLKLAESGIPVRIWGNGWDSWIKKHRNLVVEGRAIYGNEYALAICATYINLCFLRKINRDIQTTRSIEIPACGSFMLAERTDEHLGLFEEGKEAEFFSSDGELLKKVKYYLARPDERKRIAAAGRERCIKSGYSNHGRMREMLKIIDELFYK